MTPARTPACVWRVSAEVIAALDERLGDPLDSYVNGSQTWLLDNGPHGMTLEWRLHPVAKYRRPTGVDTYDVFRRAVDGRLDANDLWDGLEAFPAYGDDVEPAVLASYCVDALGIAPDAAGLVDHEPVADAWERSRGGTSIIEGLMQQLRPSQQ